MGYPFVAARDFTRGAIVEVRAFLWHMAEGYGTVSWLTHPARNVSATYVIERTGRIVQMVRDGDASHSAHVAIDPDDRDAGDCGIYSSAIARAVLGSGWPDINRYVVSIEVEGFRAAGPNALQAEAVVKLYRHLRAKYPGARGNLGHRDVQDYKSCPGCRFPWERIDGHGLFSEEVDVAAVKATPVGVTISGIFTATAASQVIPVDGSARTGIAKGAIRHALGPFGLDDLAGRRAYLITEDGRPAFVAEAAGTFVPWKRGDDTVAAALADQAARVRAAVDEALG